jgi:hypothetical protein
VAGRRVAQNTRNHDEQEQEATASNKFLPDLSFHKKGRDTQNEETKHAEKECQGESSTGIAYWESVTSCE